MLLLGVGMCDLPVVVVADLLNDRKAQAKGIGRFAVFFEPLEQGGGIQFGPGTRIRDAHKEIGGRDGDAPTFYIVLYRIADQVVDHHVEEEGVRLHRHLHG